ncbi:hypothetical protein [Okeania sp.]|uniref:hypothetical protein n=1 Tax=Okeania sp. TaxID=3100323 RepID=UPI002B4B88D8|nr:hypothetical protein [Okeania sp.]MEB3343143.1 hypothetical protein [Okeania sp.]
MYRDECTPLNNIISEIFALGKGDFFSGASQNANFLIPVSVTKSLSGSDFSDSEKKFSPSREKKEKRKRGKRGKEEKKKGEES